MQVVELREHARDLADHLVTGFPNASLRPAIDAVTGADGLIAVTPIFAASYSGLFKTFFDVLEEDALAGKPVLLGATAGTARHSLALDHALRPLFAHLRAVAVPTGVLAAADDWAAATRRPDLAARIERAAGELADLVAGPPGGARPTRSPTVAVRGAAPPRLTRDGDRGGGQRGLTEPTPLIFRVTWGLPMYWMEPTPSTVAFKRVLTRTTALAAPSTVTSAVVLCRFSPS